MVGYLHLQDLTVRGASRDLFGGSMKRTHEELFRFRKTAFQIGYSDCIIGPPSQKRPNHSGILKQFTILFRPVARNR
jgi:hypothetical protein